MNPLKVNRLKLFKLTDLPNIGVSLANDLRLIGIESPYDLLDKDPYVLYSKLCNVMGKRSDPCVLDVMMSIIDFINGGEPRVWWEYTAKRKITYHI